MLRVQQGSVDLVPLSPPFISQLGLPSEELKELGQLQ